MSDLLTAAEAAQVLGLTKRRIQQLCGSGALICRRFGQRVYLIDRTAVDAYAAAEHPKPGRKKTPVVSD